MEKHHILNNAISTLLLSVRQTGYVMFTESLPKLPLKRDDLSVSPDAILSPVYEIIQSEETTGTITTVALTILERYLRLVLEESDEWAEDILNKSLVAVKHCQFEVTDPEGDDAALLKILELFYCLVECPAGVLLTAEKMIEILNSVLRIGRETRRSELLRQISERTLHRIVELIWKRFLYSNPPDNFKAHEIFEYLCDLANPGPSLGGKSNSIRILGTSLCNTTLELFGNALKKYPSLVNCTKNQFFRILLTNATSTTNISLLQVTLRAFHNVVVIIPEHLHGQIELFIHAAHINTLENKDAKFDQQKLFMESLIELFSESDFSSFLFHHYDCRLTSSNLFDSLCKFLYKTIKDGDGRMNEIHMLSLQALLALLNDINQRCFSNVNSKDAEKNETDTICFRNIWERKQKLIKHAEAIRAHPMKGVNLLRQSNILSENTTPKDVAKFLWDYQNWINRNSIGEILRDNDEFYIEVLKEYMNFFDFRNMRIDEGLRYMTSFVFLSGEGQQVQRFLESYSNTYFKQNPNTHWKTCDNVWLVAVAVIMLHSDLHKPQNVNKMSCNDFQLNTYQGLDGVEPHDSELEKIYNAVLKSKMETVAYCDTFKSDTTWEMLLQQSEMYYSNIIESRNTSKEYSSFALKQNYDSFIFSRLWPNTNAAFRVILESTDEENFITPVIHGVKQAATLSAFFDAAKALDNLVISLCRLTTELQPKDDQSIKKFANNTKAQIAAKTMFSITRDFGGCLREGWKNVLELILRIYELDLLPENILLSREEMAFQNVKINFKPKKDDIKKNSVSSGHFWTSFWGSTSDDSLLEEQYRAKVEDIINQCRIPDLLNEAKFLQESSLEYLVKSLIFIAQQQRLDTYSTVFCLDLLTDISISNRHRLVLIFKLITDFFSHMICCVCEKFKNTANRMIKHDHIILEHTVVASIRLYTGLFQSNANQLISSSCNIHQLMFNLTIPSDVLTYVLPQLCSCLDILITNHASDIQDTEVWGIIFDQIRQGLKHSESMDSCISCLTKLISTDNVRLPNVIHCVNALMSLHSTEGSNLLYELQCNVLKLYKTTSNQDLWYTSWVYVIGGLNKLCTSIDQNIRTASFSNLQKIYLNEVLDILPGEVLVGLFTDCHFVLLDELISLEMTNQRKAELIAVWKETLAKAISLLNRSYLHYLSILIAEDRVEEVWVGILERFKKAIVPISLFGETTYEMIKNMFLVMKASGIDLSYNTNIWKVTRETLHEDDFSDLFQVEEHEDENTSEAMAENIDDKVIHLTGPDTQTNEPQKILENVIENTNMDQVTTSTTPQIHPPELAQPLSNENTEIKF